MSILTRLRRALTSTHTLDHIQKRNQLYLKRLRIGEVVWRTQEGQEIFIKDMDDKHLMNTIMMLERNGLKSLVTSASALWSHLPSNPSGELTDQELRERAKDVLKDDEPIYVAMLEEAELRSLTLPETL